MKIIIELNDYTIVYIENDEIRISQIKDGEQVKIILNKDDITSIMSVLW